jgi:hypothetical protein
MSSEKEILALEDKRFAAMIGGDWKTVQTLAHDQLLYTHSSAVTDTKARLALVDGAVGVVVVPCGRLLVVLAFTFAGGKIVEIDVVADSGAPARARPGGAQ